MALFWRIWAAVALVTFAVLAIFAGLATLQFDHIHSGLLGERLEVLADSTAAPFEAAARIGLPLSAVRNAAALLERARQTDDFIDAIHVFDAKGRIVHSTEASPPAALAPEAMAARANAGGAPWHRETAQGFFGSVDVAGRSAAAGGILVVYPRGRSATTRVWAMAAELALNAIAVMIGAAALGGLVLRLGLARQIADFDTIDSAVTDFERDSWRSAAGGRTRSSGGEADELRSLLDAADARYRTTGQAISSCGAVPAATLDFPTDASGENVATSAAGGAGRLVDPARIRARLIAMLTLIVTIAVSVLGLFAITAFERAVEPELTNRTRLIGSIVRSEIQRGLELGIPINRLVGLDRYLTDTLLQFGEVERISAKTATGLTVGEVQSPTGPSLLERLGLGEVVGIQRTSFSLPILAGNELVGVIAVQTSPQFVETRLRGVFLDVVVIALVATLAALELVLTVAVGSVGKPFDRVLRLLNEQRQGIFIHRIRAGGLSGLGRTAARLNDQAADLAERLAALPTAVRSRLASILDARIAEGRPLRLRLSDFNDVRLPLFLFGLATEVGAAFLPLYARSAARPDWLSPELAAATPLAFYLIALAVVSPFGGRLARRFGPRRLFLAAVPPTALALIAIGLSDSIVGISLGRAATAVFYAVATVACHEYTIRAGGHVGSTRASGAFVVVIFGGVFAGSALGGVIANRFGFEAAFLAGATIAAVSGLLARSTMLGKAGDAAADTRPSSVRGSLPRRRIGPRFIALLVGVVAPMNAATAIYIWYLTPLMLAALGYGPAEIARVVMLYYLAIVLFSPTMARLADGRLDPAALILVGSAASGLALLSLGLWDGSWAVTAAVAGLGVSHSLIRTPHYALALRLSRSADISLLRLVERASALLALTLSALFLAQVGAETTVTVLATFVLSGAAIFAITHIHGATQTGTT